MGYYTNFKITLPHGEITKEWCDTLEERIEYSVEFYKGEASVYGKWYECDDDMKDVSLHIFPDTLIQVDGYGEEPGDIWRRYFKNGEMQHCETKIAFEECKL